MSFLEKFLSERQNQAKPEGSRYAIQYDRWDRRSIEMIQREVADYVVAEQELHKSVDTGIEAMNDCLMSLFKVNPVLEQESGVRPKFRVNRHVISEMMNLREYEKNRPMSMADPVGAGLAAAAMEPELEVLFDKLKTAQDLAEKADELAQQFQQAYDETSESIDELLEQAQEEGEEAAEDLLAQAEALAENLEKLREQMEAAEGELGEELDTQTPSVQRALRSALDAAGQQGEAVSQFENGWGLQPGSIKRLDPKKRMELSRKLNTPMFQKLAQLIGKMQNIAIHEQLHQVDYSVEEVYDLEQGNDLARIIPAEILYLNDDLLILDFLRRFAESDLSQYAIRGEDSTVQGDIIYLEDGSSSMNGTPEIWAKSIGGALLKTATMQKRDFMGVNFSGPGSYIKFDFDLSTSKFFKMDKYAGKRHVGSYEGAEAVLDYYSTSMQGGTCFMTPLSVALDHLIDQHNQKGRVSADIVFATDGQADVSSAFFEKLKEEQARLNFRIFGIAIGNQVQREPLNKICDGFVITLKQLTNPTDLAPLFASIYKR